MGRPVSSVCVTCRPAVTFVFGCLCVYLSVLAFERVAFGRFFICLALCVLLLFYGVLFFASTLTSVLFDHYFYFRDFFHGGHGVQVSAGEFN